MLIAFSPTIHLLGVTELDTLAAFCGGVRPLVPGLSMNASRVDNLYLRKFLERNVLGLVRSLFLKAEITFPLYFANPQAGPIGKVHGFQDRRDLPNFSSLYVSDEIESVNSL